MPTFPVETIIERDVRIAAADFGGDGPAILLLHGAGGSLAAWAGLAPMLAERHRVVAMDLRGHGYSGDGDWEWEAVLDDVEAVIDHFALSDPIVVGHSFGGMIAAMWGRRHKEARGVVSLDGHRSAETDPRHYHGLEPAQRDKALTGLRELFDMQEQAMAQPLPPQLVQAQPERQLIERDGTHHLRLDHSLTRQLRADPWFRDALPVFAEVECPCLVVLAEENLPMLPPEFHQLMEGFRRGLRHDFDALAAQRPHLRVTGIAASHGMVSQTPELVCDLVLGFTASTAS